ncbi:uncharacterized protein LOC133186512 [Saccostrea echinata]|uniref:uncharacterized protein LOC133186512 n=1 Tax=Saccostrea echinata TaxID=191078 RepID=UPI002A833C6A|nr:uncharacterized protein LOC133186512 [Saccostrea echinata]
MAANKPESAVGSPQEHIPTCDKHSIRTDIFCEDCDEFICSKCAKTKHKKHNWETLANVACQRRRGLTGYLTGIKEGDIPEIEESKEKISTQKRHNENHFDYDVGILHKHFDEVINRLTEIKRSNEETLKNNLSKTDEHNSCVKSQLAKKQNQIVDTVEFIEKNSGNMSDFNLIDNLKFLKQLQFDIRDIEDPVEYDGGKIFDVLQETLSIDVIADEAESFRYGDKPIRILEVCDEDVGYIQSHTLDYVNQIDTQGMKKRKLMINPFDLCVCKGGEVFFTDNEKKTICQLFPSDSVSVITNTKHLLPLGICPSVDGGLLVTLTTKPPGYILVSDPFPCLVRHLTLTGDLIREYKYTEEGFHLIYPARITQNGNGDICIVNWAFPKGDLVILSSTGQVRSVYLRRNLKEDDNPFFHPMENFDPYDVTCDSYCNILVTDAKNHRIHLLSPSGIFLKFLLTESEVQFPTSLFLYKSKLWVGNTRGLVKVFRCKHMFNLHV